MNLKKNLKSQKGQALLEYILIFTVMISVIFIVFGALTPEKLGIKPVFSGAIDNAIEYINRSR
ncbi:MAG: hypothetical protein AB1530_03680 [Candidatus Omnitrophota bacterium]